MEYVGNCVSSTAEDINALTDSAKRITWKTFRKHVPTARDFLKEIGAVLDGATNKDIETTDWISFYKGVYRGRPSYFFEWSAIEWIWV